MLTTLEIWTRFREALLAYLRRQTRDEHLAEDLLQEVFVRVHDGLLDLEDEARVAPWLYRVARNVVADERRRHRPTEPADAGELAQPETEDDNFNEEVQGWLEAMVAELPPEQRLAVELAELRGSSSRQVAAQLGLSESGAKSRVQRGRQRLRALLSECCHLDFDRRGNVIGYTRRRRCRGCDDS